MPEMEPQQPTHVVTCFLMREDRGEPEILIVQRSQRVRTYKGHWAGISGYLEPGVTPEQQAYDELREEVNLSQDDVLIMRSGPPVAFHDEQINQSWVVHPFLFRLIHPDLVKTDWEATAHRWIAPRDIVTYPTVPRLVDALRTVYPDIANA